MTVTRAQIVAEARRWIGTPFTHQGRLHGAGVDCVGLPVGVARTLGLVPDFVDRRDYARQPSSGYMGQQLDQYLVRVPLADRLPGDLLWFAWARDPQHLGILTERNTVVHAYGTDDGKTRTGKVVETTLAGSHLAALRRAYRFPELIEGND